MANPDIGTIDCPCCEFSGAHVRETAKKRAYVVCDECSSQTFSRGSVSDASIRRRMVPVAVVTDPPTEEKELATMPPAKKPAAKKAPAKAPAKAPPKAPAAPAAQSQDEDDDGFGGLVSGGKSKGDDDFGKFIGS